MAMDASLTTIFDIPLILDEINNDLTVNEVWACSQVCRLWRALFEPYLWRSVILLRSNDPQTPTTFLNGVETNDLLQKARWIRILAIEIWDTTFADSQDLDLIELISVDNVYYTDDNQADTVEDSSSSLDLIANNPGLRRLTLKCSQRSTVYYQPRFFSALVSSTITSLTFETRHNTSPSLIVAVLRHCPLTLRALAISNSCWYDSLENLQLPGVSLPPWKDLPSLRRLVFKAPMFALEETILFPLLSHCPQITYIEAPKVRVQYESAVVSALVEHCPKLKAIHMPSNSRLNEEDAVRLMEQYTGLGEISLHFQHGCNGTLLPILIQQSALTLRIVRLCDARTSVFRYRPGTNVLTILKNCPLLTELRLTQGQGADRCGPSVRRLVDTEWKSDRLSVLQLSIGAVKKELREDDDITEAEKVESVLKLADKLKNCPNLRELNLRWCSGLTELSMETILRHVQGEVDVEFLRWMGLVCGQDG